MKSAEKRGFHHRVASSNHSANDRKRAKTIDRASHLSCFGRVSVPLDIPDLCLSRIATNTLLVSECLLPCRFFRRFEARRLKYAMARLKSRNCGNHLCRPKQFFRTYPRKMTNSIKRTVLPSRQTNPDSQLRLAFPFEPSGATDVR